MSLVSVFSVALPTEEKLNLAVTVLLGFLLMQTLVANLVPKSESPYPPTVLVHVLVYSYSYALFYSTPLVMHARRPRLATYILGALLLSAFNVATSALVIFVASLHERRCPMPALVRRLVLDLLGRALYRPFLVLAPCVPSLPASAGLSGPAALAATAAGASRPAAPEGAEVNAVSATAAVRVPRKSLRCKAGGSGVVTELPAIEEHPPLPGSDVNPGHEGTNGTSVAVAVAVAPVSEPTSAPSAARVQPSRPASSTSTGPSPPQTQPVPGSVPATASTGAPRQKPEPRQARGASAAKCEGCECGEGAPCAPAEAEQVTAEEQRRQQEQQQVRAPSVSGKVAMVKGIMFRPNRGAIVTIAKSRAAPRDSTRGTHCPTDLVNTVLVRANKL